MRFSCCPVKKPDLSPLRSWPSRVSPRPFVNPAETNHRRRCKSLLALLHRSRLATEGLWALSSPVRVEFALRQFPPEKATFLRRLRGPIAPTSALVPAAAGHRGWLYRRSTILPAASPSCSVLHRRTTTQQLVAPVAGRMRLINLARCTRQQKH